MFHAFQSFFPTYVRTAPILCGPRELYLSLSFVYLYMYIYIYIYIYIYVEEVCKSIFAWNSAQYVEAEQNK